METKVCKKCDRELPLNKNYFPRDIKCRDGFRNVCKECKGENFNGHEKKKWTEEEINILKHYYEVFGADYIRENYLTNRSKSQIMDYATKKLNLHTNFDSRRKTQEQFEKEVYDLTMGEYKVIGKYKNTRTELELKHIKCGHEFSLQPQEFLKQMGTRCPYCRTSLGEEKIQNFLIKNNIPFKKEFWFPDCFNYKTKRKLYFDFAVFDNDKCLKFIIEFHGKQHYQSIKYFGGEERFERQKFTDNLKSQYCKNKGIELLTIPYWHFDDIDSILSHYLEGVVLDYVS